MARRAAPLAPPKVVWLVVSSIGIEHASDSEEEAKRDLRFVNHKEGLNRRAVIAGPYRAPRRRS